MPYLAFDLAAMEKAPNVARAAHITEDAAIAGMARMWKHCWHEKTDVVDATAVEGFFGSDATKALITFRFLEPAEGGFRVRGANRYLRLHLGQKKGGQKSKGNLIPGWHKGNFPEKSAGEQPEGGAGDRAGEGAGIEPECVSGSTPALTPITEHRTPNKKKRDLEPVPPTKSEGQQIEQVYAHYRGVFQRRALLPSDEERGLILSRLRDEFSAHDLCTAVDGLNNSEWHRKRGWIALKYALFDRDTVERCIIWADSPPDEATGPPRYDPNQGIIRGVS